MRYPTNLDLEAVALHHLDNRRESRELRLTTGLAPITEDAALNQFLATHIERSLKDTAAQAAKFGAELNPKAVSGICNALHCNGLPLLDGSRTLAERLFAIMERDARIKPGVFAVCFYRATVAGVEGRYLALLKIDLGEVFRTVFIVDEHGNETISLALDKEALTTTREKLQKAAFVRALDPRQLDYDMVILDRQARVEDEDTAATRRTVAKFFLETFLEATRAFDPAEQTKRFNRGFVTARNVLREGPGLDDQEAETLGLARLNALTSAWVNIEEWIDNLKIAPAKKQVIRDIMIQQQPDMEFQPDEAAARRLLRRVRYLGSHDLRVSVNADYASDVIGEPIDVTDGQRAFKQIVLRTERWTELPS